MSRLFMHFREEKIRSSDLACEQTCLADSKRESRCCWEYSKAWQGPLKQKLHITLYPISLHSLLSGLNVKNLFFDEHFKATAPCSSWAMTPKQRNQHASPGTELRFIEPGLVSVFGELVKYNCVILYKAVLGWQHPQKLHYSAFYWGVKKGHSPGDE